MNRMDVVGVRVEMPSQQPVLLLKEEDGDRYLSIWIGPVEASAIAYALNGVTPPRPLTHDLMRNVLEAFHVDLTEVKIVDVRDGTYFAELVFSNGVEISARPSDSVALALRTGTPISCTEEILASEGLAMPQEQDDEVEKFREFLDTITPEDFGKHLGDTPPGSQGGGGPTP